MKFKLLLALMVLSAILNAEDLTKYGSLQRREIIAQSRKVENGLESRPLLVYAHPRQDIVWISPLRHEYFNIGYRYSGYYNAGCQRYSAWQNPTQYCDYYGRRY